MSEPSSLGTPVMLGSLRQAGELAGCSHHMVAHYVARCEAGDELDRLAVRPQLIDDLATAPRSCIAEGAPHRG